MVPPIADTHERVAADGQRENRSLITRRRLLKQTAVGTIAATSMAGVGAADHDGAKPSHVTLSFSESDLKYYRPYLVTRHLDVEPTRIYGWKATSPEESTDAYVYFTYYVTQQGVSTYDSHYLDREPIYVFVDPSTDTIREVVYAGYHWLAGRTRSPPVEEDGTGVHPTLHVAEKWHHYLQTTEVGVEVALGDLTSKFDDWLATGWEDDLEPGVAQNPWRMRYRQYWWRDNGAGFSGNALVFRAFLQLSKSTPLDIKGGENTDL